LNDNPKEVLIFNFELSDGNTGVRPTPRELWGVIPDVGLKSKTYNYNGSEWPTLQNMLDDGKQVIMFKHSGMTCTSADAGVTGCVKRIAEFHEYAVETKYEFKDVTEVENTSFSCSGDRGTQSTKDFYAINNFVPTQFGWPSKSASETVNSKAFLEQRLQDCETVEGLKPNIINVDFWDTGDVVDVVNEVNQARASQN
jgi:hypothetical protein